MEEFRTNPKVGDVVLAPGNFPFHVTEVGEDGCVIGKFTTIGLIGSLCGPKYWREDFTEGAILLSAPDPRVI